MSAAACWHRYSCSVTYSGFDLVGKKEYLHQAVIVVVMMIMMWSQKVSMQNFGMSISILTSQDDICIEILIPAFPSGF